MFDEKKVAEESKPETKKKKTADELLNSSVDDLTNEELDRRAAIVRARKEEMDLQDIKERLDERQNKRDTKTQNYLAKGRELEKTKRQQALSESHCRHQKGGMGDHPGGLLNGDDSKFALIKHILPTNELYVRCQRCGKTWKPVIREDFVAGSAGDEQFAEAKTAYKWAISANTDNKTSSSITFQYTSEDNNITARKFVHDVMKGTDLR